MHDLRPVEVEHRLGFAVVGFETLLDDIQVRIIETILAEGAPLESFDHLVRLGAGQIEDRPHVERVGKNPGLIGVTRDAVEHEDVACRVKFAVRRAGFDVLGPERDGRLVGHKLAFAGVLDESPAHRIFDAEVAEGVAAREVEEARHGAEDLALRAFARTWRAEEKDGAVFHGSKSEDVEECLVQPGLRVAVESHQASWGSRGRIFTSRISVNGIMTSELAPPLVTCR